MSPLENLLFYGRAYGLSGAVVRSRSAEILERLGLDARCMREPMLHMSRGQQQKVAVTRAFLTSPRLMLLDEPTTGLDPRSKRDVQSFIAEVRRDDEVAILLTTHDMEEAELLCDRIAFLAGGGIVAEGTPLELRTEVAGTDRRVQDVDMEAVFMTFTGRRIEDDETEDDETEAQDRRRQDRRQGGRRWGRLRARARRSLLRGGWRWGGRSSSARQTCGSVTGPGSSCGWCTGW